MKFCCGYILCLGPTGPMFHLQEVKKPRCSLIRWPKSPRWTGGAPPIKNEDPSGCGLWYSPSKCRFLGDFYKQFSGRMYTHQLPCRSHGAPRTAAKREREGIDVGGNRQVQKPPGKVIHQKHDNLATWTPETSPTFIVFGRFWRDFSFDQLTMPKKDAGHVGHELCFHAEASARGFTAQPSQPPLVEEELMTQVTGSVWVFLWWGCRLSAWCPGSNRQFFWGDFLTQELAWMEMDERAFFERNLCLLRMRSL